MTNSPKHLRTRWLIVGLYFAVICAVGAISDKPVDIILGGSFALFGLVSYLPISNWCMRHLEDGYSQELICSLVWFGLWAGLCGLLNLPRGWLLYGCLVAVAGALVLIGKAETVTPDPDASPAEFRRQRERQRLQLRIRHFTH